MNHRYPTAAATRDSYRIAVDFYIPVDNRTEEEAQEYVLQLLKPLPVDTAMAWDIMRVNHSHIRTEEDS